MVEEKIAIIADSGSDVPQEYIDQYNIKVVPLKIIFKEGEYIDKVTITEQEVYDRLETEIPKTSLPSPQIVQDKLDEIVEEGYNKVVIITISSGLSGTYQMIQNMVKDEDRLETFAVDTKNIGIGSGLTACYAAQRIDEGASFEDLKTELPKVAKESNVLFSIPTLKYLQAGGRIGKVASIVGNALKINPIISVDNDGEYYTASKARGRNKSLSKLTEIVKDRLKGSNHYSLAVAYAGERTKEKAQEIKEELEQSLQNHKEVIFGTISPALGVHTGPDLIGIGYIILDNI